VAAKAVPSATIDESGTVRTRGRRLPPPLGLSERDQAFAVMRAAERGVNLPWLGMAASFADGMRLPPKVLWKQISRKMGLFSVGRELSVLRSATEFDEARTKQASNP
jgi:hypothetical protein